MCNSNPIKDEQLSEETQKVLASIDKSRASLYVFKDCKDRAIWETLLDKATEALLAKPLPNINYAKIMIERVDEVVSNVWKRIFKWQDTQKKLTKAFIAILAIEIIGIIAYSYILGWQRNDFVTCIIFGLLGGTTSVALVVGKELKIDEAQHLALLKIILRPIIGIVSAIILYLVIKLEIIKIFPNIEQIYTLMFLGFFAGFSERFINHTADKYSPSISQNTNIND